MTATTATIATATATATVQGATKDTGEQALFDGRGVRLSRTTADTYRLRVDERTAKGARSFALKVSDVLCGKHGPSDPTRLAVRAIALDCPRNGGTVGSLTLNDSEVASLRWALRRCAAKLVAKERKLLAAQARMGRSIRSGGKSLETLARQLVADGHAPTEAMERAQSLLREEAERRALVQADVRKIETDLKAAKRRARRLL